MDNVIEQKEKKEVQETIVKQNINGKATEEEFYSILKIISPGTNFRVGLDGILKVGKGALIVVENELLIPLMDGGFRLSCRFTPQRLIELSKMDGAIVLSKDMKRINYANVLLTPDSKIKTSETGTRHKAAERTAKQISGFVIAISERKNEISIFYKNIKHPLKNTDEVLRKANSYVQILEKQRELFDRHVEKLNRSELRNYISLPQAVQVIQKGRMVQKISGELKKFIIELGNEGLLLKTRMKEVISGVEKETNLVIKDYTALDFKKSKILLNTLTYDEILDSENILKALAYEKLASGIQIKGWRMLSKSSLSESEIAALTKEMGTLGKAIHSNMKTYASILGDEKAVAFKEEIERLKLNV